MARGGYRPGAGRPKGSTKKAKEEAAQRAAVQPPEVNAGDKTPLEYMLAVMNDPEVDAARRDRMAIAAAPFQHARVGENNKREEKKDAAKEAAAGRFAPSAPPMLKAVK